MWIVVSALLAIGSGALFLPLIFPGKSSFFPLLRRALCLGFLFQLCLLLVVKSLSLQMILAGFAALLGGYFFFWKWDRTVDSYKKVIGLGLVATLFLGRILLEPVQQWDARSVWFFQGKILFYSKKLGGIWDTQNFLFGNFDYPKLHALLAAQAGQLMGFWNEYLPKFSLLLLLLPILCFLFEQSRKNGFYWAFLLLALFVPGSFLWEGYMDGYFALYALLALFFFAQFAQTLAKTDLLEGILAAGVALSLKNEGALFLLSCSLALLPALLLSQENFLRKHWRDKHLLTVCAMILLPFLLWWGHKIYYSIPSQMFLHPVTQAEIWQRMTPASFGAILQSAAWHGKGLQGIGIFLAALVLGGWRYVRETRASLGFLMVWIVVYFCGISYALYANSMELYLPQHLYHVMDRLMLTILQAFFAGILVFSVQQMKSAQNS